MARRLSAAFVTLSLAIAAAAPTFAAAGEPHYRADPAAAPAAERFVVRDLVWRCGEGGCVSAASNSRPATDCAALVRKVGAVRSFTVAGRPLAAEELEKCNARAR